MGPRGLARQLWRALCGTLAQHPPHSRAAESATSCRISCITRILRAPSSSQQRSRKAKAFPLTSFMQHFVSTSQLYLKHTKKLPANWQLFVHLFLHIIQRVAVLAIVGKLEMQVDARRASCRPHVAEFRVRGYFVAHLDVNR